MRVVSSGKVVKGKLFCILLSRNVKVCCSVSGFLHYELLFCAADLLQVSKVQISTAKLSEEEAY